MDGTFVSTGWEAFEWRAHKGPAGLLRAVEVQWERFAAPVGKSADPAAKGFYRRTVTSGAAVKTLSFM